MRIATPYRAFCLFLSLLLFVGLAFKTAAQSLNPRSALINANCKGFYEYLPAGYSNSSSSFPLLIYCSGAGSLGNGSTSQLAKLLNEGVPYYIKNNRFPASFVSGSQSFSFIVIAPQFINWPAPADVEAVLNYVQASGYKVDQSRIYLTGFSAGGDVTWKYPNTSLDRSKRLAAAVPVAAFNYPYRDTGAKYMAAANLPVWALHSNSDSPAPAYWSQNFVNKINSYNPAIKAKITRFNGVTHNNTHLHVYNPTYKVDGLNIYEWMLRYSRDFAPIAKAGADVFLTWPQASVALNGNASYDPEGSNITYRWSKVSGPSSFNISNTSAAAITVNNLAVGTYGFELLVTDSNGRIGRDTVWVTVRYAQQPTTTDSINCGNSFTIVVLGSSTAAGAGASPGDSSWVSKYERYATGKNGQHRIINLGVASATSYQILCPTGFTPPAGRPAPDVQRNITYALGLQPDAIIINLPSNDVANGYNLQEVKENYERAMTLANKAGVPVWISTTQPRNNLSATQKSNLVQLRDWTYQRFGSKAIDFWSGLADASGNIAADYNSGDGIHLNNAGHHILYVRSVQSRMLDSLCLRAANRLTAYAGTDITIVLPQSSASLSGAASSGNITSYQWRQLAGPASVVFSSPRAVATNISALREGIYQFELKIANGNGATAADTVQVTVLPQPPTTTRLVKINLYGGANPYNADGWNNWNVTGITNMISGNFNYSNGQASSINAVLNYSQGIPDNGANYGGAMCPPQVLRYTTYSTAGSRTLTIKGLSNAMQYSIELFASRATTGNITVFVINGVTKEVVTDNNKAQSVVFNNVKPVNGQVIVYINKKGTFTYLNGLILSEQTVAPSTSRSTASPNVSADQILIEEAEALQAYPNPADRLLKLQLARVGEGTAVITLATPAGEVVYRKTFLSEKDSLNQTLDLSTLRSGLYLLQVHINGKAHTKKIYKR